MANLTVFSVKNLDNENFKIFSGLYNDFKNRARSDFNFDLEPLEYDDFVNAIKNGLLECLILFENSIPTGFLIYTTIISYAIELNLIYLISEESYDTKVRYLVNELLKKEKDALREKIITYPLLGQQIQYEMVLEELGFKHVPQSVYKFDFSNPSSVAILKEIKNENIDSGYELLNWSDDYFNKAVEVINNNFKHANDALFDKRFITYKGTKDIINKIVYSTYGEFLPKYTKVITKNDNIIGICFANVTGGSIVNIPLVAVEKSYRGRKLSEKMVVKLVREIFEDSLNGKNTYSEINVTTDTSNIPAVKMYEHCGFVEDYRYTQSYYDVTI